jgi:long-chain acyl-CoA synthetase
MQPEIEPRLSVEPPRPPHAFETIPEYIRHNYDIGADETALAQKQGRAWKKYTWRKYYEVIRQLSLALVSLGLERGDTVCVVGANEPEFYWSQFAVQFAGGTAAVIPPEITSAGLKSIAVRSKAKIAVVRDQVQITKFLSVRSDWPELKKIIYWNDDGLKNEKDSLLLDFTAALQTGEEFEKKNVNTFELNLNKGLGEDTAAVYYTAGTNDAPEGIVMTHKALIAGGQSLLKRFPVRAEYNLMSVFPAAGLENRLFATLPHVLTGAILNFPQSPDTLTADMRKARPDFTVCSPQEWDAIAAAMQAKIKANPLTGFYAALFLGNGYKLGDARIANKSGNFFRRLWNIPGYCLLSRPLRSRFGLGRVRFAASDGPMTNMETIRLLHALGINLRPSFSLDETGLIAAEGKEEIDFTAVGRPTANTEVRITAGGKLLVRGDSLFSGYSGNEAKTAAAMADGWFNTGVSADIDGKGQLVISKK